MHELLRSRKKQGGTLYRRSVLDPVTALKRWHNENNKFVSIADRLGCRTVDGAICPVGCDGSAFISLDVCGP
jgi:hypothetical protein